MDEGASGDEASLPLKRVHGGGLGGSSFTGDHERYVEKVSKCGHLRGSPFPVEGNLLRRRGARIPRTLIDE